VLAAQLLWRRNGDTERSFLETQQKDDTSARVKASIAELLTEAKAVEAQSEAPTELQPVTAAPTSIGMEVGMFPTSSDGKRDQLRLVLPGPVDAGGRLIFAPVRPDARPLIVELDGRHIRFLKVLARHWRRTSDDELTGGPPFVPVSRIVKEYYEEGEFGPAPDEQTVRAYASQINRLIRKSATRMGIEAPSVHESARLLGYRLIEKLDIQSK